MIDRPPAKLSITARRWLSGLCAARMVVAVVAVAGLASCGPQTPDDPPLRIAAIGAAGDAIVADSLSLGLTARDATGGIIPGLAQSWRVSDDGLSIVFRMRDASFSDGRAITAADGAATIRRAMAAAPRDLAPLLAGIRSVAAPLPDVVELTLTTPQPEILELLAEPVFGVRPAGRGSVRAGPYGRGAAEAGAKTAAQPAPAPVGAVALLARPDFFAAADVRVKAVSIVTVESADVAIARFRARQVDVVAGGGLDGIGQARALSMPAALRLQTSRNALLLLVNQREGPLKDRRVRVALSMAIDRDRLGPALFGTSAAAPVTAIAPPSVRAAGAPVDPDWVTLPLPQRRDDALRLLAEAGFGPDAPLRLTIAATDHPADERLVTAIAQDLASVGVAVVLGRRPPAAHAEAVAAGRFDLALTLRMAPIGSPVPFLAPLRCRSNPLGICLPEADRLLAESWTAPTLADRMAALAAAERLWAEDAAVIGLVQPLSWSLVSPPVGGWVANPTGLHPLRFLTFSPDRKLLK